MFVRGMDPLELVRLRLIKARDKERLFEALKAIDQKFSADRWADAGRRKKIL